MKPIIVPSIGVLLKTESADLSRPGGNALITHPDYPTMCGKVRVSYTDEAQECVNRAYIHGVDEERQRLMMMLSACAEGEPNIRDRNAMRKLVLDMQRRVGMADA